MKIFSKIKDGHSVPEVKDFLNELLGFLLTNLENSSSNSNLGDLELEFHIYTFFNLMCDIFGRKYFQLKLFYQRDPSNLIGFKFIWQSDFNPSFHWKDFCRPSVLYFYLL